MDMRPQTKRQPRRRLPLGASVASEEDSVFGKRQRRAAARAAAGAAHLGLGVGLLVVAALAAGGCLSDDESGVDDQARAATSPSTRIALAPAFAPRLRVEQTPSLPGRPTSLVIDVTQQEGEPALASAEIVVPKGFELSLPASGAIGEIDAVLAYGTTDTVLSGRLASASVADAEGGCADGRGTQLAASLAPNDRRAADPHVGVSVFVSEAEASTRLTICPPSRDVMPRSAAIRRLTIRIDQGVTPPNVGDAVWRGLFLPDEGDEDDATESRAIVPAPGFLTLEAAPGVRVEPGSPIRLRGYLVQRRPQSGRKIRILAGSRSGELELVGRARTGSNGSYRFTMRAPRQPGTLYVAARASSVERACQGASPAPAGCTAATVTGTSSQPLRITIQPG